MIIVYLLLGSNEGKPEKNLENARLAVSRHCGEILKVSGIYETEAWGIKEQANFLNQAIAIRTSMESETLLFTLKAIERELGRVETQKWGPRVIDIDILFYGNEVVESPDLKIPHPYIQDRRFTLIPMNELAPDLIHPIIGKSIHDLLLECKDTSDVKNKEQAN